MRPLHSIAAFVGLGFSGLSADVPSLDGGNANQASPTPPRNLPHAHAGAAEPATIPRHLRRSRRSWPVEPSRPAFSSGGKQLSRGARKYGRAR